MIDVQQTSRDVGRCFVVKEQVVHLEYLLPWQASGIAR